MQLSKFFQELLVVIVLYKKKTEQSAAYTSIQTTLNILPSFPEIFIYDNSPEPAMPTPPHIAYVHDSGNSGVSKAYNEAMAFATKKNLKWAFFLDQDTKVEPFLFSKFLEAIARHPGSVAFVPSMKDRKGPVSPFLFHSGRGKRIKHVRTIFPLEKFRFINSGLLIQRSAFIEAGGYDEKIPLDFSDISFGERLRKATDHFILIDAALEHAFSPSETLPLIEAQQRFHFYCTGALAMGETTGKVPLYLLRAFLHASHLSLNYKSLRFIKIFLQHAYG